MKTITASEFRTKCYAVLREVETTGEPVIVTKRGILWVRLNQFVEEEDSIEPSVNDDPQ